MALIVKAGEGKTSPYRKRLNLAFEDQISWRKTWKEIVEYMLPREGKYLLDEQNDEKDPGKRKDQKIINGTSGDAIRTLAAGLQGGLTSPSRPWFRLTIPDKDLLEYSPVKEWLHSVRNIMLTIYARSNFYSSIHNYYRQLGGFGTAAMMLEEDFSSVLRCRLFTIGEYALTLDAAYRPNGLYRKFSMSVEQIISMFGDKNVSDSVKERVRENRLDDRFEIRNCIYPSQTIDATKADYRSMPYRSMYFETAAKNQNAILREGGYRGKPFVASRWMIVGVNTYGDSPAMDALGDVRMLQKMEEKKLKALDKHVDPPMNAPVALKAKGGTIISGGVNYIDVQQGQQGFTPAYQVNPDLQNIAFEIDRVERRIKRCFFNDLFLTIITSDKQMTAEEIVKRHEEKMMMLGPVLDELQTSTLDPANDRTYNIADGLGLIPPAPKEIQGMELKTEYIGLLAQAQKLISTKAIEQTAAFVSNMMLIKPDAGDKFDADQAIDEFADLAGTPPKVILSDDKVAEVRQQRAVAQQNAERQLQVAATADAAKKMSETKTGEGNALDKVMERMGVS